MTSTLQRPAHTSPALRRERAPWTLVAPAIFLLAWGGNHFTPLLHLYEAQGNYAPWQANLLLGTYVVGLVPGLLVLAPLSDRYGRKPLLLAGVAASLVGSILLASGFTVYPLLCIGRVFAGVGVGAAMSVGSSWIKELSSASFDARASVTAGAKRSSLTLTIGFGLGAGVTGAIAQWAPAPQVLPYVLHGVLTVAALVPLVAAPETLPPTLRSAAPWWSDVRVPSAGHRSFRRLVLPAAPWVFAAAGVAYAILPASVSPRLGEWTTLYATVLTVATLGTGAVVQSFVPQLDRATRGRALVVGLVLMSAGMALAVVAAAATAPVLAFIVALVLGAAYGICMTAGLIKVQAIATPQDLAGLTGIYYSLTYVGFLLPTALALLLPVASYAASLSVVVALCVASLLAVTMASRKAAIQG